MFAEFEAGLLRMRTREGMAIARAKGRLKGRQPKLPARQRALLAGLHAKGEHTIDEMCLDVLGVRADRLPGPQPHRQRRKPRRQRHGPRAS